MKIEVTRLKNMKYCLNIGGEDVMITEKLSQVVMKIEKYLKLGFLEEKDDSLAGKLRGGFGL